MKRIGIYKIVNSINGHIYVGCSLDIDRRWREHIKNAGKCSCVLISRALKKYGVGNFQLEVLELCREESLSDREVFWIRTLQPEYNLTSGGDRRYSLSIGSRLKISAAAKRQWSRVSPEVKRELAIIRRAAPGAGKQPGTRVPEGVKERIRQKLLGRVNGPPSLETRRKIGLSNSKPLIGSGASGCFGFNSVGEAATHFKLGYHAIINAIRRGNEAAGLRWNYCDSVSVNNQN